MKKFQNKYSIALKEFNRITKTHQIQIPEDIETVTNKLNTLGGLLTASDWARSAIVRAWVHPTSGGRPESGKNLPLLTISDFAELNIQGLSSRPAVRHYYNAWKLTKSSSPQRGEIVDLPQIPFPSWGISEGEALLLSGSKEWFTPKEYIDSVYEVLSEIDLDPASCEEANRTIKAKKFYTKEDDGLSYPWMGKIFLNPPYGNDGPPFVEKLIQEIKAENVNEAILLVNSRATDAEWFQPLYDGIICFTDHRIDFDSPNEKNTSSTHGSCFIYFGNNEKIFAKSFLKHGSILKRFNG